MTERQMYLEDAIHAAWCENNDKLRRELQKELHDLIKRSQRMARENCLYELLEKLAIHDTLARDILNDPTQCTNKGFHTWEQRVEELLKPKGYEVKGWKTLDGDSFGPLVRGVTIDGRMYSYG